MLYKCSELFVLGNSRRLSVDFLHTLRGFLSYDFCAESVGCLIEWIDHERCMNW